MTTIEFPTFKRGIVILATAMVSASIDGQCTCDELKAKQMTVVRAQDIPGSVQILGRLGQPLGSLLTIRGEWIDLGPGQKDPSLRFQVTLVNGKELGEKVQFHGLQIQPILSRRTGRGPNPGELWDWRADYVGTEPWPTRSKGETWEMIGVETGCFEDFSEEALKEFGLILAQKPDFMHRFYTRFMCIAVRKLSGNQGIREEHQQRTHAGALRARLRSSADCDDPFK